MSTAMTISRVLVGVDFDDASAAALRMASLLASRDAHITVFHASTAEAPAYFTADQIETLEAEREQGLAASTDQLRVFAAKHARRGVNVVVEEGAPDDALVRMAANFDLIVVGTHRRQGMRRWWLGSVAEAVVRKSRRPVLVVPDAAVFSYARRPSILAAGDAAGVDRWVDALRSAVGGDVVRSMAIHECAPGQLQSADLIVIPLPPAGDAHFGAIVQVLKACVHPVLFVPSIEGSIERSPS